MILGAAKGLYPLIVCRPCPIDIFGNRRRADKTDRLDARVGQQCIDRFLVAIDHIDHAVRATGFACQFDDTQRTARILLRWLEDEGIPAGERNRHHPQRHHRRKVERRDTGTNAEGLSEIKAVDVGPDIRRELTLQKLWYPAGELNDLNAARDRTSGIVKRLAMFARHHLGQFIDVLAEQFLEAEHDAGTIDGRAGRPFLKRSLCCRDGRSYRFAIGQFDFGDLFAGCRIVHRTRSTCSCSRIAAADKMTNPLHAALLKS